MIRKYRYGNPFPTGAVACEIAAEKKEQTAFRLNAEGEFTLALAPEDCVYGLGEAVRGINKRGWHYESCNEDDPIITEKRTALYGAHNFIVVAGKKGVFGAFFDCADRVLFDIGYTDPDELRVKAVADFDLYIVEGKSAVEVVREFRKLIGDSYIPPKWAFGFGQSRWGYRCEADIREVADGYAESDMPLDMIYLDIDYMDHYKDFTVNKERYPDLKALAADMKKRGIRLIPIIDAGVKVEKGYDIYEEGVEKGYFCKDAEGEPYVVGVWPGDSVFPDVLNPEARKWFGSKYRILLDEGIEGFWNDMNEPSIFYSKKRLAGVLEKVASARGRNMPLEEYHGILGAIGTLANNRADYAEFFHDTPNGTVSHLSVHNLFGCYMTRAAAEYFEEYQPDKRYLLFSRSSHIGMHRYGGIWTGDNASWWTHLLLNLKMLPSLNMCGFLYVGADIGGFGDNTSEDLLLRWTALGIFTPLMRNHSTLDTRMQECFRFKDKKTFRNLLGIRYALVPWLYSEFVKSATRGDMMFRPLAFDFPDDRRARTVEDQLMVGEGLMIAPVYEQNAAGRYVCLPEEMKMIRMRSATDYEETMLSAGDHYLEIPLTETVFFLRKGHALPLAEPAKCVDALDETKLRWIVSGNAAEYEMYIGNGESKSELKTALRKLKVPQEKK